MNGAGHNPKSSLGAFVTPIEKIEGWLERHPFLVFLGVVSFFLAVGTALRSIDRLNTAFDEFIQRGLNIGWPQRTVSTKTWFFVTFLLISIFFVYLGLLVLRAQMLLRKARRELQRPESELRRDLAQRQEREQVASKTLREMMAAASRIREQLFPAARRPVKVLISIENTYLVYKNFDCAVSRVYEIKAADVPVHFWEIEQRVESAADPVDYLDDIDFKVRPQNAVAYLPSYNDLRCKKVVIYFLPQIEPSETNPRKILVSYRWPGMFKQLERDGQEAYSWKLESKYNIPRVRLVVYLEPGTGLNLHMEPEGSAGGKHLIEDCKHPERGWAGKVCTITDAPPGEYKLRLRVKKP